MKQLKEIKEAVFVLQTQILTIITLIYQKRNQEAYQETDRILTALVELSDTILKAREQGVDIPFDGEQLKSSLISAMDAIVKGNLIGFSVVLQYEIGRQVQSWIREENSNLENINILKEEACTWANQYRNCFYGIKVPVFFFGLGNGYYLKALLEWAKEDSVFFIVEPDSVIYETIKKEVIFSEFLEDNRLHFLSGMDRENFSELWIRYVNEKNASMLVTCIHPQYAECFQKEYRFYLEVIRDCQMKIRSTIDTAKSHGTRRAENMLISLQLLLENKILAPPPKEWVKQIPMIIVAAGPSLDQNIEDLKKAKGKAIVLAVDRAAHILKQHGIIPDLMVTVDPIKDSVYLQDMVGIPLLCNFASNQNTMRQHNGNLIFYGAIGYIQQLLRKIGQNTLGQEAGGSVATAAFSICKDLGIETIILVGQDLAFKNGHSHAAGEDLFRNMKKYQIEGINGELIETRADWYLFLRWFEQEIQKNPQINVIDATEGGAKIHGSEIKKLSEVLEELPGLSVATADFLRAIQYSISEEENKFLTKQFLMAFQELKQIEDQAKKGFEISERLWKACRNKSIGKPEYGKQAQRLRIINEELKNYEIIPFLEYYSGGELQEVLGNVYQMGKDTTQNQENTYQIMRRFYQLYAQNSQKLADKLEQIFLLKEKKNG